MAHENVIYHPPASKVIEQYAIAVCNQLAQSDDAFSSPQVASGLAHFLGVVARLTAKHLNEGHHELLDNLNEQR